MKLASKGTYPASPGAGEAAVYQANARLFRMAGAQVGALCLVVGRVNGAAGCVVAASASAVATRRAGVLPVHWLPLLG